MRNSMRIIRWLWVTAIVLILGLTAATSSARAAPLGQHSARSPHTYASSSTPARLSSYTHTVHSITSDRCAEFSGDITVGTFREGRYWSGFIDVNGTLTSRCGNATLYVHFSTGGAGGTERLVASTGPNSHKRVAENPFIQKGKANYTNVYIFVCTNHNGYRCGNHSG